DHAAFELLRRNVALNPSLARAPEPRLARITGRTTGKLDVTLDDLAFAGEGFVPDLVKLDVEGWELRALEGGERLLAEQRPHLVVETHSVEHEREWAALLVHHSTAPLFVVPRRTLA